jgi:hypothetical protein
MGLCAVSTNTVRNNSECEYEVWDSKIQDYVTRIRWGFNYTYAVYQGIVLKSLAQKDVQYTGSSCTTQSATWSPAEPRVTYNDPNLP